MKRRLITSLVWLDFVTSGIGNLVFGVVFGAVVATAICIVCGFSVDFDDSRVAWIFVSSIFATAIAFAIAMHWLGRLLATVINVLASQQQRNEPPSGDSAR